MNYQYISYFAGNPNGGRFYEQVVRNAQMAMRTPPHWTMRQEVRAVKIGYFETSHQTRKPMYSDKLKNHLICYKDGCGKHIHWQFYQQHLDSHLAQNSAMGAKPALVTDKMRPCSRGQQPVNEDGLHHRQALERRSHKNLGSNYHKQNLGSPELGPHAFEKRMPKWLHDLLRKGGASSKMRKVGKDGRTYTKTLVENEIPGIILVLDSLLRCDRRVSMAFLCHPSVQHVFALDEEGDFCGYRNIQMLISYIIAEERSGWEMLCRRRTHADGTVEKRLPGVLDLQEMIEAAWSEGINTHCKIETGGIWDTRKYIGTAEVESLMLHVRCRHKSRAFCDGMKDAKRFHGYKELMDYIAEYFLRHLHQPGDHDLRNISGRIHRTSAPPIYLQQPGHSITIVGIETYTDGSRKLLVLDPGRSHQPKEGIYRLIWDANEMSSTSRSRDLGHREPLRDGSLDNATAVKLLEPYRVGTEQLSRHRSFEILELR